MIDFLRGYNDESGTRINLWSAKDEIVKTTFNKEGEIVVVEGSLSSEEIKLMQEKVDKSVREIENND